MNQLPSLLTIHNTYISVTSDYLPSRFHSVLPRVARSRSRLKSSSVSHSKIPLFRRNSRIIQIGHSVPWSSFITLTFSNDYYWSDYSIFQSYFRKLIKSFYYQFSKIQPKQSAIPSLPALSFEKSSIYPPTKPNDLRIINENSTSKLATRILGLHSSSKSSNVPSKAVDVVFPSKRMSQPPSFRYLAVLEHGGKTNRIHYHMLTDIPFNSHLFVSPKRIRGKTRKRLQSRLWPFGFSDVVSVNNKNCSAVFYLCKYLTKLESNRTPVGKREVFCSRGLNKVQRIVTYNPQQYLTNYRPAVNLGRQIIYYKKKQKLGRSPFSERK